MRLQPIREPAPGPGGELEDRARAVLGVPDEHSATVVAYLDAITLAT